MKEYRCIVCGRKLKSPESIRNKMGATCRSRLIGLAKEKNKKQKGEWLFEWKEN